MIRTIGVVIDAKRDLHGWVEVDFPEASNDAEYEAFVRANPKEAWQRLSAKITELKNAR